MATLLRSIHLNRLAIAVVFTVLVADTVPHPSLSPSLIGSQLQRVLQR